MNLANDTYENTLKLSFHKDPITLDPQQTCDKVSSAIIFLLFKGLTRLNTDHSIDNDIASSFYSLDDCKKYVFHLGNHSWSDGTPITAHDFVYSWKRALSPNFPARAVNFFYHIKNAAKAKKGRLALDKVGIRAENDKTLVVELENSCPYFPELTSFCPFFPIPYREGQTEISSIASGAFQLESWETGKQILLKKNKRCSIPSDIDQIRIQIIPDEKKAFALFENNELDWIGDPISPLPVAYLPSLSLNKQIKPLEGMVSCWFNTLKEPFNLPELRKAFSFAIPRRKLLEKMLLPPELLTKGLFSCIFEEQDMFSVEESQGKAKALFRTALNQLNLQSLDITLSFEATDLFSRMAAQLKSCLEGSLDISIQLEPLPFKELFQRLRAQKFQAALIHAVSQYTDPINFLERFEFKDTPRNFTGWEHPGYQETLNQYRTLNDPEHRLELAKKAEKVLLEEMPIAPIYYEHYAYLQKPHVHNLRISPVGIVHFDRASLSKEPVLEIANPELFHIVG